MALKKNNFQFLTKNKIFNFSKFKVFENKQGQNIDSKHEKQAQYWNRVSPLLTRLQHQLL